MEQVQVQVGRGPRRCPWCRDEIAPGKEITGCAGCSAQHHADCWGEHGRCAACGGEQALVSERPRRRDPSAPPKGSTIQVRQEGETTRYEWPMELSGGDWFLLLLISLSVIMLPLTLLVLWNARQRRRASLVLGPEEMELSLVKLAGGRTRVRRLKREDLGKVQVDSVGAAHHLTIDVGIERLALKTGHLTPRLGPPELEWLAEVINAWKERRA